MSLQCKKCGWSWQPRREDKPKVCPRCKSYDWNGKEARAYVQEIKEAVEK